MAGQSRWEFSDGMAEVQLRRRWRPTARFSAFFGILIHSFTSVRADGKRTHCTFNHLSEPSRVQFERLSGYMDFMATPHASTTPAISVGLRMPVIQPMPVSPADASSAELAAGTTGSSTESATGSGCILLNRTSLDVPVGADERDQRARLVVFSRAEQALMENSNMFKGEHSFTELLQDMIDHQGARGCYFFLY